MSIDDRPALMKTDPKRAVWAAIRTSQWRRREPTSDGDAVHCRHHGDWQLVQPGQLIRQADLGVVHRLERAAAGFVHGCPVPLKSAPA
jgi:hypothetical protein